MDISGLDFDGPEKRAAGTFKSSPKQRPTWPCCREPKGHQTTEPLGNNPKANRAIVQGTTGTPNKTEPLGHQGDDMCRKKASKNS